MTDPHTSTPHQQVAVNPYEAPQSDIEVVSKEAYGHVNFFARYGRIGRLRYLLYTGITTLVFLVLVIGWAILVPLVSSDLRQMLFAPLVISVLLIGLLCFLFVLSFVRRRLNDMGWISGLLFLMLVPGLNLLFFVLLAFLPGQLEHNRYGAPPPADASWVKILSALLSLGLLAFVLFTAVLILQ